MPPSRATLLKRGLLVQCPACGGRGNFPGFFSMREQCGACGLTFERIAGHWTGAIGISIILSFPALAIVMVGGLIATAPDFKVWSIIIAGVCVGIFFPILIFPLTRTLWTALDIMMRPLRPDEVDWTVAGGTQPKSP